MLTTFKKILAEPLLQFLVLGTLLFLLVSNIQKQNDQQSLEITVDKERVALMIMNYRTQTGILPSKQQIDGMIDNYIKEEISYREAKKMGLDKDDEIIRRRLSQKFDFIQTDLTEIPEPSAEELKSFYEENPALFQKEATVSFSHLYFSTDETSDSAAIQRAEDVLQQLEQSNLQRAPEKGDRFPLLYDYTEQSYLDIQQNFGDKPLLQELFNGPVNTWLGPVQSGYGWHLLFISRRDSATEIPFASIREDVKTKYLEAAKATENKKTFDQLSKKYSINREYLESK